MKLFVKHLWRSLCRAPVQSLMIVLTVAFSMAIAVSGIAVSELVTEHSMQTAEHERQLGEIFVTTRGDSQSRILFAEDVQDVIGDDARVLGEFSLIGFMGESEAEEHRQVSVAAVDLVAADAFYEFEYRSYGRFDCENLNRSVVIAERFAKEQGLCVGDTFILRLVGEEIAYTVEAIAVDEGLLHERDVLVSFSGLRAMLAEKLPAIASLGDSFAPCSRLLVKANDGVSGASVYERLLDEPTLSGNVISLVENQSRAEFWAIFRLASIYLFLFLLLLLAGFLIGTSLTLLHRRRGEEYASFAMAGADSRQIAVWAWLESAGYALLGVLGGSLLAIPLTRMAGGFYAWNEEILRVRPLALLGGAFMTLSLMGACTLRHRRLCSSVTSKADGNRVHKRASILWPVSLWGASLLATFLLPAAYRYLSSILSIVSLIWLTFLLSPILLVSVSRWVGAREESRRVPRVKRLLAAKQLSRSFLLGFACRLLSVMIALLLVIGACESILSSQVAMMTEGVHADFVVYALDEKADAQIAADPAVDQTLRMYYTTDATLPKGASAIAISAVGDLGQFVPEAMIPKQMPFGDQIVLSEGLASLSEVRVGERIALSFGGMTRELTVVEILHVNANFVFFDADAFGIRRDLCCVNLDGGANAYDRERVVADIEGRGAYIESATELFSSVPQSLMGHLQLLKCAVVAALLLGSFGALHLFLRVYYERNEERLRLGECGMTRRTLGGTYVCEMAGVLLTALLIGALVAFMICVHIDVAMRSFGMVMFT